MSKKQMRAYFSDADDGGYRVVEPEDE
jgi:hypothetical protein